MLIYQQWDATLTTSHTLGRVQCFTRRNGSLDRLWQNIHDRFPLSQVLLMELNISQIKYVYKFNSTSLMCVCIRTLGIYYSLNFSLELISAKSLFVQSLFDQCFRVSWRNWYGDPIYTFNLFSDYDSNDLRGKHLKNRWLFSPSSYSGRKQRLASGICLRSI